jgi:hypothetical protein
MTDGPGYRFEPWSRRGVLLGLGWGQLAMLALAVVVAVALVKSLPGPPGFVGGAGALAAGVGLCRPVAGRPPLRWAGLAMAFCARPRRVVSAAKATTPEGGPLRERLHLPAPTWAPGLYLTETPAGSGGGRLGVVVDEKAGSLAAIVRVPGGAFCLVDEAEQERRLGSWAAVLEPLCHRSGALARLQWCQRAVPGDAGALVAHLRSAGRSDAAGYQGQLAMLERAGPRSLRHETLLVVVVRARARRGRPSPEGTSLLWNEVRSLRSQMRNVGLGCEGPLDGAGAAVALGGFLLPDLLRHPGAHAWPLAVEEHWAEVHADLSWHRTYWVAEWPRSRVGPDFLSPLLVGQARRSFSVIMAPVPPERAARDAESARTAQLADAQLRSQGGFLETAKHRRAAEALEGREVNLADGRGSFELVGYLSVSADDRPGLEQAAADLERAAGAANLCIRPLYGQQKQALTWALPFGRGL